jgi:hypothetical protein
VAADDCSADNHFCGQGQCTTGQHPSLCDDPGDCQSTLCDDAGQCSAGGSGDQCAALTHCPGTGLCSFLAGGVDTCTDGGSGQACFTSEQCLSGQCDAGSMTCAQPPPTGEPTGLPTEFHCLTNDDCSSSELQFCGGGAGCSSGMCLLPVGGGAGQCGCSEEDCGTSHCASDGHCTAGDVGEECGGPSDCISDICAFAQKVNSAMRVSHLGTVLIRASVMTRCAARSASVNIGYEYDDSEIDDCDGYFCDGISCLAGNVGEPCYKNYQCHGLCVNEVCTTGQYGSACTNELDCVNYGAKCNSYTHTCGCLSNADCGSSDLCIGGDDGWCSNGTVGAQCLSDDHCDPGNYCSSGSLLCLTPPLFPLCNLLLFPLRSPLLSPLLSSCAPRPPTALPPCPTAVLTAARTAQWALRAMALPAASPLSASAQDAAACTTTTATLTGCAPMGHARLAWTAMTARQTRTASVCGAMVGTVYASLAGSVGLWAWVAAAPPMKIASPLFVVLSMALAKE